MLNWLVEQLILIIFHIVFFIMMLMIRIFVGDVSFASGASSLSKYLDIMFGPGNASILQVACFYLACFLLLVNFFIQIYRNIFEDDQNAPSPFRVAWNTAKYLSFAVLWGPVTKMIMGWFGYIYSVLIGSSLGIGIVKATASGWADSVKGVFTKLTSVDTAVESVATDILATTTVIGFAVSVLMKVMLIVIIFKICVDFFKFLIDIVQRLVIVSIFWVFGPLAFGCGNNIKYEDVPKLYMKTFISQLVAIIVYHFWVLVIVHAIFQIGRVQGMTTYLSTMVVLAIVEFGRSIDGYLGQIGLRTGNEGAKMGDKYASYAAAGAKLGAMGAYSMASSGMGSIGGVKKALTSAYNNARSNGSSKLGAAMKAAGTAAAPLAAPLIATSDTAQFLSAAAAQGSYEGGGKMQSLHNAIKGAANNLNREGSKLRAQMSVWGMDKQYSGKITGSQAVKQAISSYENSQDPNKRAIASQLANTDFSEYSVDTNGNAVVFGNDRTTGQQVGFSIDPAGNVSTTGKGIRPEVTASTNQAIQRQKLLSSLPSRENAKPGSVFQAQVDSGPNGEQQNVLGYLDSSGQEHIGQPDINGYYPGIAYEISMDKDNPHAGTISYIDDAGFAATIPAGYNDTTGSPVNTTGTSYSVSSVIPPASAGERMQVHKNGMGATYYNSNNEPIRQVTIQKTDSVQPTHHAEQTVKEINSRGFEGYSVVSEKF